MKNDAFSDVTRCGSCKNRRFGETQLILHQGDKNLRTGNDTSCKLATDASCEYYFAACVGCYLLFQVHRFLSP
jgi:predicted metal-binding protein